MKTTQRSTVVRQQPMGTHRGRTVPSVSQQVIVPCVDPPHTGVSPFLMPPCQHAPPNHGRVLMHIGSSAASSVFGMTRHCDRACARVPHTHASLEPGTAHDRHSPHPRQDRTGVTAMFSDHPISHSARPDVITMLQIVYCPPNQSLPLVIATHSKRISAQV